MRTGGVARRATFIDQVRGEDTHVLLVDAGNAIWSDRPYTVASDLRLSIEMLNALGYDAVALGNRDLQLGADLLLRRLEEANFLALSANVVLSDTGELLTAPFSVHVMDGHRIAILGLTGQPAPWEASPGLRVLDPLQAAGDHVPYLATAGDVLMVLSNAGPVVDAQLEVEFPQIDLIVAAGQAGTTGRPLLVDELPPILQAERSSPGHAGRYVGQAHLTFDAVGELQDLSWQFVALGPEWGDDPGMKALVARYATEPTRPAIAPLTGQ